MAISTWSSTWAEPKMSAKDFFQQQFPEYGYGGTIDTIREEEFPQLKGLNVFLIYGRNGLSWPYGVDFVFPFSTKTSHGRSFLQHLRKSSFVSFSFPLSLKDSQNASSLLTSRKIRSVRESILQFFQTTSKTHSVIFTSGKDTWDKLTLTGCTHALKMVGENFPWTPESQFCYLNENHNSVLGIREYCLQKGAKFHSMNETELSSLSSTSISNSETSLPLIHNLVALPAENNFSGEKFPLDRIKDLRQRQGTR